MSETDLPASALAEVSALRYALTTDPFPLEASPATGAPETATLKVVGSNPDPSDPVTIRSVIIAVPVGPDAAQLTDVNPSAPVAPDGWTLTQTRQGENIVEYVFKPQAGQAQIAGQGLAFVFNDIQTNKQPGVVVVEVTEGSDGPVTQLVVTKFPNDWGEVFFSADPPIIPFGGTTSLRWSGPADAIYSLQYYTPRTNIVNVPGAGDPPLSNRGRYPAQDGKPLQLLQNTTFYLNVAGVIRGKSYSAQKFVEVTVTGMPPGITCFKSEPATAYGYTIAKESGDIIPPVEVTLSWTTEHAKECELSGVAQLLAKNALLPQSLTRTKSYLLTAYGNVDPAATKSLNVDFKSAARMKGKLSHPQPSVYQLDYTVTLLVPVNSDVQLEIIVLGRNSQNRISNHSSVEQSYTSSASIQYDKWDDNALVVITCTGSTSYKLSFKLSDVVGTIPH